jgi:hypothetical protein
MVVTVDSGSWQRMSMVTVSPAATTRSVTPCRVGAPTGGGFSTVAASKQDARQAAVTPATSNARPPPSTDLSADVFPDRPFTARQL